MTTRCIVTWLAAVSTVATAWQTSASDDAGDQVGADAGEAEAFHFAWEISPLLARQGCAAADCHGGASGRGGFKLSLFSSNPREDYLALTRDLGGRRIDLVDPENSLVLRKPARQNIKHGGGRLLRASGEDTAYLSLLAWIERGAPWSIGEPSPPSSLSLTIDGDQVRAVASSFGDEQVTAGAESREVTELTRFESTNEAVAEIDEDGRITRIGPGETWLVASYGQLRARTALLVPFTDSSAAQPPTAGVTHPMDTAWLRRLGQLGLRPSPPAEAHELVRRLYFDLAGRPPLPAEVAAFLARPEEHRMTETVGLLVAHRDFERTFARHLATWFEIPIAERDPKNAAPANTRLREFFDRSMQAGDSLETVVRNILLDPAARTAWQRLSDPRDRAEYLGRTTLGRRIDCARCHNHPHDQWRQEEHLAFSAFFSDPRPDPASPGGMLVGRFFEPETGREIAPALLPLGQPPPPGLVANPPPRDQQVAWFILEGARSEVARHFANRVFESLIGRPLVSAADDQRLSNPAIHEPLLELLAETLETRDFDLRALVEFIATSRLYAASSLPKGGELLADDPTLEYLARREARRLSSDDLRRAVAAVMGVPVTPALPADSPLAQQLFLLNSGLIQDALATPGNQIEAIHDFVPGTARQFNDLFLLILSRPPSAAEIKQLLPSLTEADDPRQALFDLAFALLASREFGSVR